MKRTLRIGLGLAIMMTLGSLIAMSAPYYGKILNVKIGKTASEAKGVAWHNISMRSLRNGDTEYEVKDKDGNRYKIQLTERQVQDILDGTTVHAKTLEGGQKVQVTLKELAPKRSGW